ncbi:MAG: 6-phosphogluconolactonase [Bryobacteraceae bacterium]
MSRLFVSPDARAAAEACAHHALALLEKAIACEEYATFAVSGGSTPGLMFDSLATKFRWDRVHLFWVDERAVAPDSEASNYKLAYDLLIAPAGIRERNVHRIHGELEPREAARLYTAEIRRYFELGSTELPRFDVVHRGVGPDGHTASLFPGNELLDNHDDIAAPVFAPQFNQWRITLLPGVLKAARNTVVLAAGADKAEAVRAVFQDSYDPKKWPAQIARDQAHWFLDRAAAAKL